MAGAGAFSTVAPFVGIAPAQAPDQGTSVRADLTPAESLRNAERAPSGNPLWAIPLKQLSSTRERPIFSPSRRPPPPVVVDQPFVAPVAARVERKAPEPLALTLLGTIIGEGGGLAMFVEPATQNLVRLRTGEAYLRSVKGRDANLEKDNRTEIVSLPPPSGTAPPAESLPRPTPPGPGIRGPRR
jgi:general secretion pathway protein N